MRTESKTFGPQKHHLLMKTTLIGVFLFVRGWAAPGHCCRAGTRGHSSSVDARPLHFFFFYLSFTCFQLVALVALLSSQIINTDCVYSLRTYSRTENKYIIIKTKRKTSIYIPVANCKIFFFSSVRVQRRRSEFM